MYLHVRTDIGERSVTNHPVSRTTSTFSSGNNVRPEDFLTVPGVYPDTAWFYVLATEVPVPKMADNVCNLWRIV
jgi:hypothetical protein